MPDILVLDQTGSDLTPAQRLYQAVRADALARALRYQGDDCHLLILAPTSDDPAAADWLALHAVEAWQEAGPAPQDLIERTPSVRRRTQDILRASVLLTGDLHWSTQTLACPAAQQQGILRHIQRLLTGQGPFANPTWRLAIQPTDWPAWQHCLAQAGDDGWLPPVSIHPLPLIVDDNAASCCPRCGAITAGLPDDERRRLCALPATIAALAQTQPDSDALDQTWRPGMSLELNRALMRFDTPGAMRIIDQAWRAFSEWEQRLLRCRVSDQEWQAYERTRSRQIATARQWLQLLIPLPVDAVATTPAARDQSRIR